MFLTESEQLEYKTSFSEWKELIISLAAFANKKGGMVVVGRNDGGDPTMSKVGKRTIEDIVQKIKQNTDPILYPSINVKTHGPGEIVEIAIPESDYKPVFAFGRGYTRVGKTNQKLSVSALRELMRQYTQSDFDRRRLSVGIAEIEVDDMLFKTYTRKLARVYPVKEATRIKKDIGLAPKTTLTYAAYLCFARYTDRIATASIQMARFKGKTPVHFIDMQMYVGNILAAPDDILKFIKKHINVEARIPGYPVQREDVWDYPAGALREAIINAVVHRDYSVAGHIQIRIFDDRLEVWSPGTLPKEIDIRALEKEHRSIPRNQLIADIFHVSGVIEKWGTGLQRIFETCEKNGNPPPLFEEKTGALVTTFLKRRVNEGVNGGVNEGVNGGVNDLMNHIRAKPGLNAPTLAKHIHKPVKTVERWIAELKKDGKIGFQGSPKKGGYFPL